LLYNIPIGSIANTFYPRNVVSAVLCYDNMASWMSHASIVSKRLNLS